MKRLREDVHDTPPFGSSPRESHDQSQVRESGLGKRGGGSRRAGRDGAGASKTKLKKTVDFEEAISLVNKVKKCLGDGHKYKSFLDILSMYRKEQKEAKEVYHEAAVLLNDHPDLLDEFARFLPDSATANPSNLDDDKTSMKYDEDYKESDHNEHKGDLSKQHRTDKMKYVGELDQDAPKNTYGKESTFCGKVKERLGSPDYQAFLKSLDKYSREIITRKQLQSLVADTLGNYPDLMEGFNEFIERYDRVGETTKWNERHPNSKLVKEEEKYKTEAPSTYQIKYENEAPPRKINLEEAISFVKKLKEHFENDDHLYKSFLDILKMYREEHKNIYEVYHEVAKLLNDYQDLLDDFTKLLPDSSDIAMLKDYLDQLTNLFSSL